MMRDAQVVDLLVRQNSNVQVRSEFKTYLCGRYRPDFRFSLMIQVCLKLVGEIEMSGVVRTFPEAMVQAVKQHPKMDCPP
jgi:hypothetical protein